MKINETGPREISFVLWGHCQNLLDDPRRYKLYFLYKIDRDRYFACHLLNMVSIAVYHSKRNSVILGKYHIPFRFK